LYGRPRKEGVGDRRKKGALGQEKEKLRTRLTRKA
jgi:hypothetical protein